MKKPQIRCERPVYKESLCLTAQLVHLAPFFPKKVKVLDVGCGEGYLDQLLIREGCQVTGIDYDQEAITVASFFPGSYQVADIYAYSPKEKYDFIVCTEVLEHLPDDKKALKLFYSWLKPGGRLLISVPSYMKLSKRLKEESGHFRHYQPKQLKKLTTKAGFRIEQVKEYGSLIRRLILQYQPSIVPDLPCSFMSRLALLLSPIIKLETRLWPFSDSLILLVTKPKLRF